MASMAEQMRLVDGWVLFILSTSAVVVFGRDSSTLTEHTAVNNQPNRKMYHTDRKENSKEYSSFPRIDSDMSLGLNRSESVNELLTELGEFCTTGKVLFGTTKLVVTTGVIVYLALKLDLAMQSK